MEKTLNIILTLSLAGTLFAGYLSGSKLLSDTCALDAGCSYFLGYPTCYYGFVMYVLMLLLALGALMTKRYARALLQAILAVAVLGTIFSAVFTFTETVPMITAGVRYGLILPTCAYGLVMYVAISVVAYKALARTRTAQPIT